MNVTLSDTLYHFTNIEALISILTSKKFRLSLNRVEWLGDDGKGFFYDIPMVCFCETPLEFLTDHSRTFGDYGVGINIKWVIENGLHNVIYSDNLSNNIHSKNITKVLQYYKDLPPEQRYDKNINDYLVGSSELMIYREEREWRYIGEITNYKELEFTPIDLSFSIKDLDKIVCKRGNKESLEDEFHDKGLSEVVGLIVEID